MTQIKTNHSNYKDDKTIFIFKNGDGIMIQKM